MELTLEEQIELWRWAIHNKAFDLLHDLDQMRSTFKAFGKEKIGIWDKWTIAERQFRVCNLELENLRRSITALDFKPKEDTPAPTDQ